MLWDKTKGSPEPVHALDRIPERENNDPLVDLRLVAPNIKILRPATIPWCRKRVAEMVKEAASKLPNGYGIGVTDAWRPIERQRRIYDFMWNSAKEAFPDRPHASLRRTVNRWVAPPYRKAPPGHCTGAALDVNLVDANGEIIDVSAPYERFKAAPTYTLGLDEEAARNRMLLVDTMLEVGFSNCRDEWWHYSYGDAGWAVRMGEPICVYGLVKLDPSLYQEQERLAEEAMKERTNPFV
ncbi:MAG TPA: M15 family metallopeptidase [Fimbriimonadaceae bacterium]|jgi:D-alanyl-D-alanine dipeptidase